MHKTRLFHAVVLGGASLGTVAIGCASEADPPSVTALDASSPDAPSATTAATRPSDDAGVSDAAHHMTLDPDTGWATTK